MEERGSVCRTLFGLTDGLGGRNSKNATPTLPVNARNALAFPLWGRALCCKRVLIDGLCFRGSDDLIDGFLDGLDHLKRGLLADDFAIPDALNVCREDAK
jgi:hypothetical protein